MGLSKIYEIVLNSDPGLAFLLDTNRHMVNDAVAHALRIDAYIERYGLEAVEHLMDIGFALDRHIDPHTGLQRQPYPPRRIVEQEHRVLPYDDLMETPTRSVTYA